MSSSIRDREDVLRKEYDADGVAENYAGPRWEGTQHARRTHRLEHTAVKHFLEASGPLSVVLDLPCGTGRFGRLLKLHSPKVLQMDQSAAMLGKVSGPRGQAAVSKIPLASDSVDVAFSFRLLHHFRESFQRSEALAELARVSRRWVIGTYFDRDSFQALRHRMRGKKRNRFPQSKQSFHNEAELAGLKVVEESYVARGVSEQVVVLLEKTECSQGVFEVIKKTETSSVECRNLADGCSVFVKRYTFPKMLRRLEAAFRHTWRGPSRAEREFFNLQRLREAGIPTVRPLSFWVKRDSLGFVRDSWVATEAHDSPDLEAYLHSGRKPSKNFIQALEESVAEISNAGVLYRGLLARNVLVTDEGPVWLDPAKAVFAKQSQSITSANEKEFRKELWRLGLA
ncbi:MAG: class I SAM-dependent methyltransferase [Planctomycetota bacterium]|nr:class I SAM-dependent methyltransferase [Planctomycetota bacterium]